MKKKYLIDCFRFIYDTLGKELADEFDFALLPDDMRTKHASEFAWKNFWRVRKMYRSGEMNDFAVVHFNRAESMIQYTRIPGQISVFEIHGFDVGILGKKYLRDLHTPWKRILGTIIDAVISRRVIRKVREADILYVSTPDLVEPIAAWCGRTPEWLPNSIDISLFSPEGPKATLAGSPACFLAARLHGDKKPEIAFDIFENHILKQYPNAVLHLLDTGELAAGYKQKRAGDSRYVWHRYMDKPTLASTIRAADLVFGDFSIGALSLLPMQVMAAGRPIVTLDRYEIIKTDTAQLPALALRLLGDHTFREETIAKNRDHVIRMHTAPEIAKLHLRNLTAHSA